MTEVHLNSVAVCNLHQQKIDSIDVKQLMKEFVANSDMRKSVWTVLQRIDHRCMDAKATL